MDEFKECPHQDAALKILVITCGGEREKIINQQFKEIKGIDVDFSPGVDGKLLSQRYYWEESAKILLKHEEKSSENSETYGWNPENSWDFVKKLCKEQRGVLGNFLAHLIAMKSAVENGYHVVLEDGVRCSQDFLDSVLQFKSQVTSPLCCENEIDFLYLGYLGSVPHLEEVYQRFFQTKMLSQKLFSEIPVGKDVKTGKSFDLIWGSYAYMPTDKAFRALVSSLRSDMGKVFWKLKRGANVVKPIDKVMPRQMLAAGLNVCVVHRPVCFRSPGVKSRIHRRYDLGFFQSTTRQLELTGGRTWDQVWLSPEERNICNQLMQQLRETDICYEVAKRMNDEKKSKIPNNHQLVGSIGANRRSKKEFASSVEFVLNKSDGSYLEVSPQVALERIKYFIENGCPFKALVNFLDEYGGNNTLLEVVTETFVLHIAATEFVHEEVLKIRSSLLNPETVVGPPRSDFQKIVDNIPGEVGRKNKKWRRILKRREKTKLRIQVLQQQNEMSSEMEDTKSATQTHERCQNS